MGKNSDYHNGVCTGHLYVKMTTYKSTSPNLYMVYGFIYEAKMDKPANSEQSDQSLTLH